MTKIVRFKNRFYLPGFHRRRFPVGICMDVPDGIVEANLLPKSAEVLPDSYMGEEEEQKMEAEAAAIDVARLNSNSTALAQAHGDVNLLQNQLRGKNERLKEADRAADEAEKAEDEANARIKELETALAIAEGREVPGNKPKPKRERKTKSKK